MSIQINGIDKPKSCFDCPCIDAEFEECAAREHYLLPKDEYGAVLGEVPDWCPITEPQTCEDSVSRADVIELVKDSYYNLAESIEDTWAMVADVEKLPAVQPQTEWNNHTVACLLAELFGDACACNYNGIDEWLPEKCEVIDACPNPVGVACWEQFLKHRAERRTDGV